MMNTPQDRTYWRSEPVARLIDEAKHYPSAELCIALGERLEDAPDIVNADDWRAITTELDEARAARDALDDELNDASALIEALREDLYKWEQRYGHEI